MMTVCMFFCMCFMWSVHTHVYGKNITFIFIAIVFIIDTGKAVFVWIGSGASESEKKNAMTYAHVRCFFNA